MYRQNSPAIFKVVHEWPPSGGLKPGAMMECGVVVTNGRVVAPAAHLEVGIDLVSDLHALDINAPFVGGIGAEYQLAQETHLRRELRRQKQVKLTNLKGVVDWRRQRKNQRVCH